MVSAFIVPAAEEWEQKMIRIISKALSSAKTSAQKELQETGKIIAILAMTLPCCPGVNEWFPSIVER